MAEPQLAPRARALPRGVGEPCPRMSLGRVLVLGGAARKKHPNAASIWGIVVGCMGGGCCTHGLVWISLAFGIGSHQFCHRFPTSPWVLGM